MQKRIPTIILTLTLLLSCLSGCSSIREKTATIRVGITIYQQNDTFITTMTQYLEQLAKQEELDRGIKLNLNIVNALGSQAYQNEQVDRFLSQGYDILCVNIVDRTAAAVIIDKAKAANVPVIFFNREPVDEDMARWNGAYYVGSKAAKAGSLQGSIVLDAWKADPGTLDKNGDGILQYVILEGEHGHQDTLLRTEYSIKKLSQAGVPMEKLANDTANWQREQARVKMLQWLEKFADRIEVVFANNDDMALGVIDACTGLGLSGEKLPFIVGVDAIPPALEAMKEGTLKGTVLNDAQGQAKAMLALSCALALEEAPAETVKLENGNYIWLDYTAVTPDNLDTFLNK